MGVCLICRKTMTCDGLCKKCFETNLAVLKVFQDLGYSSEQIAKWFQETYKLRNFPNSLVQKMIDKINSEKKDQQEEKEQGAKQGAISIEPKKEEAKKAKPKKEIFKDNEIKSPGGLLLVNLSNMQQEQDEEIVKLAKNGDELAMEFLIQRYESHVRAIAKSYFMTGGDREDIIQEGMTGLFEAIRDYRANKLSSFRSFAELCITRQIITAIKTATRQKHIPLNSYISFNKPIYSADRDRTMLDILSGIGVTDPEENFIQLEFSKNLRKKLNRVLSELEENVLNCYLEGKTYEEMAREFGIGIKSVDNAFQRVKRKIEKILNSQSVNILKIKKRRTFLADKNVLIEKFKNNITLEEQRKIINCLSKFEKQVFEMYLRGCGYKEISKKLEKSLKTINNALGRVMKKIREILEPVTLLYLPIINHIRMCLKSNPDFFHLPGLESKILKLIMQDRTYREIGKEIGKSVYYVKKKTYQIIKKIE